ncbi:GntR family transcriptional regulator [Variovorax sp. RA8]|uniref:GntR family transcriptional regulator n=1 Tax=Variovorax sp. (strain JCM 16519 / RA8) TaxID=662548 RepID=UPI0013184B7A|nr:GntR family transcriptional regulator [Variovorax sp. RA8]VTU29802.1 HTH-type transcriptional regulator FrlR [Variovorax sp. RA8]
MQPADSIPGAPLHFQISTLIKDGIASGRYHPGDQLPTEEALGAAHGVSRVTVRRALKSLELQGLIERKAGRGTFVSAKASVLNLPAPIGPYLERVAERRALSRPVVKEFDFVAAPPDVRSGLQLPDGAVTLRVVRLRLVGRLPIVHTTLYLPEALGRRYKRSDFGQSALSELLAREGHVYSKIDMVTRARLATPLIARLLHVEVGAALVDVHRIGYDATGRPIEYQQLQGPPDRFETHVVLMQPHTDAGGT